MATKKAAVRKSTTNDVTFSFIGANTAAATIPAAEPYQSAFRVRKQVADQVSQPTLMVSLVYVEALREIRVMGADGHTRKCKIDRLPSIDDARALMRRLKKLGTEKKPVQFVAAGGFSPNVWFYTVK
jgi:hypothetical protein